MTGQGRVKLPHHQLAMFIDTIFMGKLLACTIRLGKRIQRRNEPYRPPARSCPAETVRSTPYNASSPVSSGSQPRIDCRL
ncbi:hypothetical protein B0909_01625 [Rhizobium rhizogenes]|nr:hypothetical protein B0909_01625 [Rhizobium rhizogenes]